MATALLRKDFRPSAPHRQGGRSRILLLLACTAVAITFLGMHKPGSSTSSPAHDALVLSEGSGQWSAGASRRRSLLSTASHRPALARPPSQQHTFLVMDPNDSGSGSTALKQLEPYLAPYRQYPEAVAVTVVTGPAATSLAAQFALPAESLPAVAYLPPMWQNGANFKAAATLGLGGDPAAAAGFSAWAKASARMSLLLMNDWDNNEVCFSYLSSDEHREVEIGCSATQVELWQEVSLLDTFTARNRTGRNLLAQHVALFSGIFAVHPPGWCNYLVDRSCRAAKLPHPTDEPSLSIRRRSEASRAAALIEQPRATKHFTTVGFQKSRAPQELFQALAGYLNASWENVVREVWDVEDTFTNHFDAPSMKVTLPESGPLKPRLFEIVQGLLEQWIGGAIPLESTAMYGIRLYSTDNTLAMHCDRAGTHIVSAIINVGQDVDEPWPLQILDHAGKEHSVEMQPGDLVMYEGASCAHGRRTPLKGRFFANVFVHFKPK